MKRWSLSRKKKIASRSDTTTSTSIEKLMNEIQMIFQDPVDSLGSEYDRRGYYSGRPEHPGTPQQRKKTIRRRSKSSRRSVWSLSTLPAIRTNSPAASVRESASPVP
jgi:ABC-type glutathione transport system ATPase component